jgi:hypothetical protein
MRRRSPSETIRFLTLDETARLFRAIRAHRRGRALFLLAYRPGFSASSLAGVEPAPTASATPSRKPRRVIPLAMIFTSRPGHRSGAASPVPTCLLDVPSAAEGFWSTSGGRRVASEPELAMALWKRRHRILMMPRGISTFTAMSSSRCSLLSWNRRVSSKASAEAERGSGSSAESSPNTSRSPSSARVELFR